MKKRKIVVVVCSFIVILLTILMSYAYFTSIGQTKNQEMSGETGTLALIFADGNPGINQALEFGSSVEKIFTIENTGSLDAWAKINFEDLINTYNNKSLTYTLSYSDNENGNYVDILTDAEIPVSEQESTHTLANTISVPRGVKYYYKLTITLNYLSDIDQTEDLDAILSTHFKLEQGSGKYTITFMDGEEEKSSKEVIENATYGELPVLEKNGFVFVGWFTEEGGEGREITSETIVNIRKNQTLYAYFKELFSQKLISKANDASVKDYNSGDKGEMFTFPHSSTYQTPALTDYRYIGDTPKNYINFNNEMWRIIGVFSVQNENNQWEQRIKIMRESSINKLVWNEDECNDWSQSTLLTLLNSGAYYNRTSPYSSTGLTDSAKKQIAPARWYLGGAGYNQGVPASDFYIMERGRDVKGGDWCGDRNITTVQNVGLMYPSDNLYTYAYGVEETCFTDAWYCSDGEPNKGWIFNTAKLSYSGMEMESTVTPFYINANSMYVLKANGKTTYEGNTPSKYKTRPAVYLIPDIEIISGDGTSANPYILKNIE